MKKIVTGIVALALASSVFAADFAAKVKMTGDILAGTPGDVTALNLKSTDQKDADALVVSVGGDEAGAKFQFFYKYDGTEGQGINVRGVNLWFKPVDMVKVTVGDVSVGTYKEQINWWKDVAGGSVAEFNSWAAKYASKSSVEGAGVSVEVTPIDGLWLQVGTAAGTDNPAVNFGAKSYGAWGCDVKYDFNGLLGLPMTAAVSVMDNGAYSAKVISVGADYGAAFGEGFYGFLNARFRCDDTGLVAVALDNYYKFSMGAWKIAARTPVVIRTSGATGDDSYMLWQAKFTYALDSLTPYINVGNDLNNDGPLVFADLANTFNITAQAGATFNVGSCALDLGVKVDYDGSFAWSVPFEFGVAF